MGKTDSVTPVSEQPHRPSEVRISTHLVLTLCGLTSQKTSQGGLGLSGSVHEEAYPCFPNSV